MNMVISPTDFMYVDYGENRVDQDGKQHPGNAKYGWKYSWICNIGHYAPPCEYGFCLATESYHTGGLFIIGGQP
jgi:hypothetical protein